MMRRDGQHVGVWLAEGGVLHALDRLGVIFDPLQALPMRGLGVPRFYTPA